jgi:hypothetical protein
MTTRHLAAIFAVLQAIAPFSPSRASGVPEDSCRDMGTLTVSVELVPPAGVGLTGVKVILDYPEDELKIPGFQNDARVKERVHLVPQGFMSVPNDTDTELILAVAGTHALPTGTLFTAEFDRCNKNGVISAKDFHCKVDQASDEHAKLVDGATCSVELKVATAKDAGETR